MPGQGRRGPAPLQPTVSPTRAFTVSQDSGFQGGVSDDTAATALGRSESGGSSGQSPTTAAPSLGNDQGRPISQAALQADYNRLQARSTRR